MKAILAIDSYKGCLSSREVEKAAAMAFTKEDAVTCIPVSDGGEGFSSILTDILGGETRTIISHDPLGNTIEATYGIVGGGSVAVIDTATSSGLSLVPPERRNPLYETSYGTGELIADALTEGVDEVWIGLGGSATCDGGLGMLQALGYRFLPPEGIVDNPVMANIISVDDTHAHRGLRSVKISAFYDVDVPFCGRGGAALAFAPQKGAGPQMAQALDSWMDLLCGLYSRYSGLPIMNSPGAGAAGGIGGAMTAFLHARMYMGVERFLEKIGFEEYLSSGENSQCIVVTGEGKSDFQTLTGKLPLGVLRFVRTHAHPSTVVILLSGRVDDPVEFYRAGFDEVVEVTPRDTPPEKITDPEAARRNIPLALEPVLRKYRFRSGLFNI